MDFTSVDFDSNKEFKQIFKDLLRKSYVLPILLLVLIFSLGFSFLGSSFVFYGFRPIFAFSNIITIFVPFLLIIIYLVYLYKKALKEYFVSFAQTNGFDFTESISVKSFKGKLFNIGHSRVAENVVSGLFKDHSTRFFHYRYSVGHGKHKKTYNFTVWEISFEKTDFPYILLRSKTMRRFGSLNGKEREVSLRDDLARYFRLYVTEGYEVEALQIFTPEFVNVLSKKGPNFSIEFAGKNLYIYDDVTVNNNKKLKEIYEVAKEVFVSAGPLLNRLHDDFENMHRYYRKK